MKTINLNSIINATNINMFAQTQEDAQLLINQLNETYLDYSSRSTREYLNLDNSMDRKERNQATLAEDEARILYLEGRIPQLEEGDLRRKELELEMEELQVEVKKTNFDLQNSYGFEMIIRGLSYDINQLRITSLLGVLKNIFDYVETQSWTIDDYGLKAKLA
ncbi:hypothetical protein [Flammeovirga sp. SJP92]|uniref:hypothetical protein n=1 Tax=Flammeovirga sp. SJP92 TaxID=1775430 RepID=UPI000787A245|nr:hypothetical protein [Flammeovirga sp. SJP92]KXX70481.1 hypothetical protein AVL50_08980 [Flammeovirga sp. SJP92]